MLELLVILSAPLGTPEPYREEVGDMRDALVELGLTTFPLAWLNPTDWDADIDTMRERWGKIQVAPPVEDAARFGDADGIGWRCYESANYAREFNRRRFTDWPFAWFWKECEEDADARHVIYDLARTATGEGYELWTRRVALGDLLRLLGPEDYAAGALPLPVDLRRIPTR